MSNYIREYLTRIDMLQIDIAEKETFFEDKARHVMIMHVLKQLATVYCMLESCLPDHQTTHFPCGEGNRGSATLIAKIKNNAPVSFSGRPRGIVAVMEDSLHDTET